MSDEKSWKEKALEAVEILKKISQPPLQLATLTGINEDTVDIALTSGNTFVVYYNPKLKDKFELGQTVRISPETMAVIGIEGEIKTHSSTTVKDIIHDGRVKVETRSGDKVIQTAVKGIKVGDNVLVDNGYSIVVENIGNNTKAYKIDKVPEVPWSSIGGLEKTIEQIKDGIELPFTHKELYSKFPGKKPAKGILLYGPPGCGKTMLGKAIAFNLALRKKERDGGELNGYFLYAAGPEFLQKYVGTGEEKVRGMFANARETAKENGDPVVIFVDEPEAVLKQRGTGISSDASDPIVNQFLVEMDGLNSLENILVLFASNRPELLDAALVRPGRIDRKIYVPRPNKEATERIFSIYLKDLPLESDTKGLFSKKSNGKLKEEYAQHAAGEIYDKPRPIVDITYQDGSKDTLHYRHIFSGAGVVSILGRATDHALKRGISGEKSELTFDDLSKAVDEEYMENKDITNQITKDDIKSVAKDRFDKIIEVRPSYVGD